MLRDRPNRSTLTYAVGLWGGIALTTWLCRLRRRKKYASVEAKIAQQGGLLPEVHNVVEALEWRSRECSDKLALKCTHGTTYSWKEYHTQVQLFGRALMTTQRDASGHGVAVHAFNEPRWFFAALGALAAGWTISGIYLTNTYDQAAHVLKTSDVKVLVLETSEQLETIYKTLFQDFPGIQVVILNGGDEALHSSVLSYDAFLEKAADSSRPLKAPKDLPGEAVTSLVYTSGTTGNPKAVQLTHTNIKTVCAMMHARIPLSEDTKVVSYLPLSHIAAMGIDLFSSVFCGAEVHFADSKALSGTLKDTLLKARPTLFFGVPRVWEKMAAAMQEAAAKSYEKKGSGQLLKIIGKAAKAVGAAWWSKDTPELIRCCFLAVPFGLFKTIAFRKVRRRCGLDRCELMYTGAADCSRNT